jgi:hypothetical protein
VESDKGGRPRSSAVEWKDGSQPSTVERAVVCGGGGGMGVGAAGKPEERKSESGIFCIF